MKRYGGVAFLGMLALLAAACAEGGPSSESAASGGTLVIGSTQIPRSLNPAVQSGLAAALPGAQLFASPVEFGEGFEPEPYLARSWKFSGNGRHLTLNLVKNAVFHDGKPITSADVAFSIDVVKKNHPFGVAMLGPVESVDTPDKHTVVINLAHRHPAIMLAMSPALLPVLPEHVYGRGGEVANHPRNSQKVIGSGPFKLKEHVTGQRIVLERFDRFFRPDAPRLRELVIDFFPGEQQMSLALQRGSVDYAPITDPAVLARLAKVDSVVVSREGGEGIGALNWLEFNVRHKILDDVRVRQAIAYAIDKKFIQQDLLKGFSALAPSPIHPDSPYFDPNVNRYERDLTKAASLLDDAGYPEKSGGTRFSLKIDYLPGVDAYQRNVAEAIKSNLAEVGIAVEVRSAPDFPTWSNRVSNYDFDMTMDNVWNWGDPVIGVQRTYLCANITKGVVFSNMARYCNKRVDALLQKAAVEQDRAKRKALYNEFQETVVDDIPIHFLTELRARAVYSKSVQDPPVGIWGPMTPITQTSVRK